MLWSSIQIDAQLPDYVGVQAPSEHAQTCDKPASSEGQMKDRKYRTEGFFLK